MAVGFIVMTVGILVVLGLFMVFVFGFFKLLYDMKMHALKEAADLFGQHFACLENFIKDPATPEDLASTAIVFSQTANSEAFAKMAVARISSGKFQPESQSKSTIELLEKLNELDRHRPDLVKTFHQCMSAGLFAAVYRHAAKEMSPIRAYVEVKAAKSAENVQKCSSSAQAISSASALQLCQVT